MSCIIYKGDFPMNINTLCIHGSNVYRNDTGAISVLFFKMPPFPTLGLDRVQAMIIRAFRIQLGSTLRRPSPIWNTGTKRLHFPLAWQLLPLFLSYLKTVITLSSPTIFTVAHTGCLTVFPPIMGCSSRRSTPRIQQRSRALSHLSPKLFLSKRRPTP